MNQVKNMFVIRGKSEDICAIHELVAKNNTIDFNRIFPIPADLQTSLSGGGKRALKLFQLNRNQLIEDTGFFTDDELMKLLISIKLSGSDAKNVTVAQTITHLHNSFQTARDLDIDLNQGKRYLQNQSRYGTGNADAWVLKNWGTSSNNIPCESNIEEEGKAWVGKFISVGCQPEPIYRHLAMLFPALNMRIRYLAVDEDFAGTYSYDAKFGFRHRPIPENDNAMIHDFNVKYFQWGMGVTVDWNNFI